MKDRRKYPRSFLDNCLTMEKYQRKKLENQLKEVSKVLQRKIDKQFKKWYNSQRG